MNKLVSTLAVIAFMICSAVFSYAEETDVMIVGYFNTAPYAESSKSDTKEAVITYLEKYIAPEMGVRIQWIGPPAAFENRFQNIKKFC